MSKYLEMPWNIEDTIENLKEVKEFMQMRVKNMNLDGKGETDAEEVAFDFDRAIKALEEVHQYREIGTVEECRKAVEKQKEMKSYCDENTCVGCPYHNTSRKDNKCMNDFIAD